MELNGPATNAGNNLLHSFGLLPDPGLRLIVRKTAEAARIQVYQHARVREARFSRRAFSKSAISSSAVVPTVAIMEATSSPARPIASMFALVGFVEHTPTEAELAPIGTNTPRVSPCRVTVTGVFDSRIPAKFARNSLILTLVRGIFQYCLAVDTIIALPQRSARRFQHAEWQFGYG